MSLSIQTNVASLVAQNNIRVNTNFQNDTITQLSSGYRINSSADDAAGLAVANQYRGDTAELNQGVLNANNGVAQLQIADGGLKQHLDHSRPSAHARHRIGFHHVRGKSGYAE
jgi:flagellin